mmetsp:Transcript_24612/g.97663  ORF Transcript_24612/g.97663 Transcript_24612/m.97663 type:complete len:91 (-) Transcript_24612:1342-1614(-)
MPRHRSWSTRSGDTTDPAWENDLADEAHPVSHRNNNGCGKSMGPLPPTPRKDPGPEGWGRDNNTTDPFRSRHTKRHEEASVKLNQSINPA